MNDRKACHHMNLEDYLEFLSPEDIRIRGTRIGIEHVLHEFVFREKTAKEIVRMFPSLSEEQVHGVICYYLGNRDRLDHYLRDWLESCESARRAQAEAPSERVARLRSRMAERRAARRQSVA